MKSTTTIAVTCAIILETLDVPKDLIPVAVNDAFTASGTDLNINLGETFGDVEGNLSIDEYTFIITCLIAARVKLEDLSNTPNNARIISNLEHEEATLFKVVKKKEIS